MEGVSVRGGQRCCRAPRPCALHAYWGQLADGGEWWASLTLQLLSRVGNNLGERRRRDKSDIQLQKGRLPCHCRRCLGGESWGEVASSSSLSSSHEVNVVWQREGRRIMTTIARGEVASLLSSRGVGKDLGERVAGERPMMARGEHVVIFVAVVGLDPGSVKPPLPWE